MEFSREVLKVARVVNRDDPEFVTLEVMRTDKSSFSLGEGDEFLTLIFVRRGKRLGELEPWDPIAPEAGR